MRLQIIEITVLRIQISVELEKLGCVRQGNLRSIHKEEFYDASFYSGTLPWKGS